MAALQEQKKNSSSPSRPLPPPPLKGGCKNVAHLDAKLANLGSTCYLNATLQALFHTTPFMQWLTGVNHKCKSLMCLTCQLQKTVESMTTASKTNTSFKPFILFALLRVLLKKMSLNLGKQEDAHEFFLKLFEQLDKEYYAEPGRSRSAEEVRNSPMNSLWGGWYISTCSCSCCKSSSSKFEQFSCLSLPITDKKIHDVGSALKFNFSDEAVEYKCLKCGNSDNNTKSCKILHPPNILAISLNRFEYEGGIKIGKSVPIDSFLILKQKKYMFRAAVVHIGSTRASGHYYTFAKCPNGSYAVLNDNKKIEYVPFLPGVTDNNGYLLIYEQCRTEEIPPKYSSTPLKTSEVVPPCHLSPVLQNTTPTKRKERDFGSFKVTPLKVRRTETQGSEAQPAISSLPSTKGSVEPSIGSLEASIGSVEPSKGNLQTSKRGVELSKGRVEPSKGNVAPCRPPVLNAATPKEKAKEVNGFKIAPLKIVRMKRQDPKTSPTQSANDYFIKTNEGIRNKVSPLKIVRQKRATKATSTQSANEYFIRPNEVDGGNRQTGEAFQHSSERIAEENGSCSRALENPISFSEENDGPADNIPDIVLYPKDVPGAILPNKVISKNKLTVLQRWLQCYGYPKGGTKKELIPRVQSVMDMGHDKVVVSDIDDGKWYNEKVAQLAMVQSQREVISFPTSGWKPFPSIQIPVNFNFGHIYYYLVESMPHLPDIYDDTNPDDPDSDSFIGEDEEDDHVPDADPADPFSEDSTMAHHKKFRRGLKFLKSRHVGEPEDNLEESLYFFRSKVKASMDLDIHTIEVALSVRSGSIKRCTCQCKQRALGRCAHVSATLLYLWHHVKLNGYEAVTCTSRPCEWNQGSLTRNPGKIKEKTYPAYKIDVKRRQTFDPRATKFQLKSMTQDHINRFLGDLSGGPFKTRFEYHLKTVYADYKLDRKQRRRLTVLCRQFLKNQRFLICKEIPPSDSNPLHSYEYEELAPDTVFEVPGTGLQGNSDVWCGRRSVVLGASVSHRVCHLTNKGVKGFLRSVMWNIDGGTTAAMRYGTKMEPIAREAYLQEVLKIDDTASISSSLGFHINSSFLAGGCSPDGIVISDIFEDTLLEIKCPFTLRNVDPELFDSLFNEQQMKDFCLERDGNGEFQLKKDHKFYYQVQQNMGILKIKHAVLVVYSDHGMITAPVTFDEELYQYIVTKVTAFQRNFLVPEYFEKRAARDLSPIFLDY